jgi:hypothetical protein
MTTQRLAIDVVEAGKMLGLGRSAAYAAAARGQIPTLKFGRKLVVPLVQLEAMLRGEE